VIYTIDAAARLISTAGIAPLKYDEVIRHFRELFADPACAGSLDVLLDLSGGDTIPVSSQLARVKTELCALGSKIHFLACAIVAPNDAIFGMMRMLEVFARNYFRATRVFRDATDARAWPSSQRTNLAVADPQDVGNP
jgi:hypothetical protein